MDILKRFATGRQFNGRRFAKIAAMGDNRRTLTVTGA
jgi:hypothetical protein